MQYKDTILVVHPPGGYGRILTWFLMYFSGEFEKYSNIPQYLLAWPYKIKSQFCPVLPGSINFTNHNDLYSNSQDTVEYLTGSDTFKLGNTSADFIDAQQHKSYIHDYQHFFKKIVLLTQDPSCQLMVLHNKLKKLTDEHRGEFFDNIITRFKEKFAAHDPVPTWQLREMISFDYCLSHVSELYQPVVSSKIINISINQLVHHFQDTITRLLQQLDLPLVYSDQFDRISNEWLSTEQFINIDRLCQDIVTATVNGSNFSWKSDQLTIIDEAFIQYQLRNKNLEMRCYGLDTFPTNSVQLKELLYPV